MLCFRITSSSMSVAFLALFDSSSCACFAVQRERLLSCLHIKTAQHVQILAQRNVRNPDQAETDIHMLGNYILHCFQPIEIITITMTISITIVHTINPCNLSISANLHPQTTPSQNQLVRRNLESPDHNPNTLLPTLQNLHLSTQILQLVLESIDFDNLLHIQAAPT